MIWNIMWSNIYGGAFTKTTYFSQKTYITGMSHDSQFLSLRACIVNLKIKAKEARDLIIYIIK